MKVRVPGFLRHISVLMLNSRMQIPMAMYTSSSAYIAFPRVHGGYSAIQLMSYGRHTRRDRCPLLIERVSTDIDVRRRARDCTACGHRVGRTPAGGQLISSGCLPSPPSTLTRIARYYFSSCVVRTITAVALCAVGQRSVVVCFSPLVNNVHHSSPNKISGAVIDLKV